MSFCFAKKEDSQVLTVNVAEESSLSVSGNPPLLSITLDDSGKGSVSDSSTTYTITSNSNKNQPKYEIIGEISSGGNMPNGSSLSINLSSNAGKSTGTKILSTSPQDLVLKIKKLTEDTGDITYTFAVTEGTKLSSQSLTRVVTLTLLSL